MKKFQTLEEGILLLRCEAKRKPIAMREILHIFPGKGRALVLLLLSLPFCLPFQIPGLSTPFGLIIAFIGLRTAFGKQVWLPKRILSKKITSSTLLKITKRALFFIRKMKHWICPRYKWICHSSSMKVINGVSLFILGIFLALPLPVPFSNLITAWPIFFIALGMLGDDGILVLIGYLMFILAIAFFMYLIISIKHAF